MTDDQRVGTEQGMPYLWGQLRRQMTYYPNAQVPNNNCCPSRSSFLSGRYSHTTGVWDNTWNRPGHGPDGGWRAFNRRGYERNTIAVALRGHGYRTVLLGKYLNQYYRFNDARVDIPPGWSDFHTFLDNNAGYFSPPDPIAGIPPGYTTDTLGDAAVQTIAATPKAQPLFILYTPHAPHNPAPAGPYQGTAAASGALQNMRRAGQWSNPAVGEVDRSDKPRWLRKISRLQRDNGPGSPFPAVRTLTAKQADTLMGVDANVRKIVQAQQAVRDWDNTMVVFLSDNGIAWGDHNLFDKTTPYRLTNGIPLLIKYPSWVGQRPSTDGRLINQLDVTATIAQLAEAPMITAGRSALQPAAREGLLLQSPASKGSYPWWHPSFCGWRTKEALYVRYGDGAEELYDYTTDPFELTNRAANRAYRSRKASLLVSATLACTPAPPGYHRPSPRVRATATAGNSRLVVKVDPGLPPGRHWTVIVQSKRRSGTWRRVTSVTIRGNGDFRTLNLDKGTYRARVKPGNGFTGSTSRAVRLRR